MSFVGQSYQISTSFVFSSRRDMANLNYGYGLVTRKAILAKMNLRMSVHEQAKGSDARR